MICESCKFDNREGALFCAECGKPLASANKEESKSDVEKTVILDEVVTNSKESVDKEDESEANTTVLTSDMLKPVQSEAPKGFTPGPAPVKPMAPMSPQGQPMAPNQAAPQAPKMPNPQGAPMSPQGQPMAPNQAAPQAPKMPNPQGAPMSPQGQPMVPNQAAPQAPKMSNPQGAPMSPQGQPMAPNQAAPQAPKMSNSQAAPQAPKMPNPQAAPQAPEKSDKKADKKVAKAAKKANKGKMGTGTKVYIVISIILILALGGALAYGYFVYHKGKMDDAKTEKEALITDYESQLSEKNNEIANLYASSTDAQATITSLETQLAESQAAQTEAQATADSYVAYQPLIDFAENCTADSNTEMMVSDSIVSMNVGDTAQIYVYFSEDEGHLNYLLSDTAKADCEWGEEWVNGNVLPLSITAKEAGDITIEITNDQNETKETIFVHIK